jgi:MFS family permease
MSPIMATDTARAPSSLGKAWPLFVGMSTLMLGIGLQGTLTAYRGSLEGFAALVTGAIMSCYYLGFLFGTTLSRKLVRQVGHIRVFAALAASASVAALMQGLFVNPWAWGGMRLLSGLCLAGIYVVAESWLNDMATPVNRGRLFAIYMLVLYLGLGSGQFLLLVVEPRSPSPFMIISALISLALVPIMVSAQQAPAVDAPANIKISEIFRNSPMGLAGVCTAGMVSAIIFSMGPVYARAANLPPRGVAQFMAVSIFAGALTQYPIGRLSDRFDRRTIIAWVCAITATIAATLVVFQNIPHAALLVLTAAFSGLSLTLYSVSVSHVNDKLQPEQMVAASSKLLRLNGGCAAVGPIIAGELIAVFGPRGYFGVLGTLMGLLAIYDMWRKVRRKPTPPAQKARYMGTEPTA